MNKGCSYWIFIGFWLEPMIWIFKVLWLLFVAIVNGIISIFSSRQTYYLNKNFDDMDGHEFEYFCAELLRKNGYVNVRVTQGSGDHGIDVLAVKNDITYAIQCKCYQSNIGNKAVQEAYSGKSIYKADIAVVMTNRYYTEQARSDAKKLCVELWDRNTLLSFVRHAKKEDRKTEQKDKSLPDNNVQKTIKIDNFQLKKSIIKEYDMSNQRENFDRIIEENKSKKEEKIVYDKERGIFPAGEYVVGEDIPVGRYLFKARDKKQNGNICIYESYQKYVGHDYLSSIFFDGDYFSTLRENGLFVVVQYADFQKMDV